MSGPVRPPLTTKLDNDSSENRPVNTIAFANTDFSLTNSGTKTTVALSGGGGGTIGGSIAANQVAFGKGICAGDSDSYSFSRIKHASSFASVACDSTYLAARAIDSALPDSCANSSRNLMSIGARKNSLRMWPSSAFYRCLSNNGMACSLLPQL